MTWKNHTINISNKCLRVIGILNIIKHVIPINVRLLLYNTLILPHLNDCITAWGYQCNRIVKLQNKALRTVSECSYNAHTGPLFKNLRLLKIKDMLKTNYIIPGQQPRSRTSKRFTKTWHGKPRHVPAPSRKLQNKDSPLRTTPQ